MLFSQEAIREQARACNCSWVDSLDLKPALIPAMQNAQGNGLGRFVFDSGNSANRLSIKPVPVDTFAG